MDLMPDKPDTNANPEQKYASAELTRRILHTLTPRELECLRLRSRGLRYAEIAEVLSIRPGTVATLLSRCTARINQMLNSEGDENSAGLAATDPYAT